MKILMGSILNFDKDINGVVVSAKELMNELHVSDHQVKLITPYGLHVSQFSTWLMRMSGIIFKKSGWSLFFMLNMFQKIWIIARQSWSPRKDVDVFHAHDIVTALAFLILPRGNRKIFFQAHFNGSPWQEFVLAGYVPREGWAHRMMKMMFSWVMRSQQVHILAVSEHSKAVIQTMLGSLEKEPVVFYPGIRSSSSQSDEPTTVSQIINVGSLEERKDQRRAIDLLIALRQLGLKPQLHLVGPEDEDYKEKILEKVRDQELQDQVHFHGQLSEADTRKMIGGADLYLHTAKEESFGRVIVEAMSSGTPVAAFEYPALREILEDDSILERTDKLQAQASLLADLLTNPTRLRSLQKSQYSKYLKQFTPGKMIQDYEQLVSLN